MTKRPHLDAAIVEDAKIADHLLNAKHPRGGAKARFLIGFGFAPDRPEELRLAVLAQARENDVSACHQTDFGVILEIEAALPSPDGRNPHVRAVWMIDRGSATPHLITMVPRVAGQRGGST